MIQHEFTFVTAGPDDSDVLVIPGPSMWFPLYKTNEARLLLNEDAALFVSTTGMSGSACKYLHDPSFLFPDLPVYKLYRHIRGEHRPFILRRIPSHNALLTVNVTNIGNDMRQVDLTFISGNIIFTHQYPASHRLRVLNFKTEVLASMQREGLASINTQIHLVRDWAVNHLRGNALIWAPVGRVRAAIVPRRRGVSRPVMRRPAAVSSPRRTIQRYFQ